MSHLLSSEHAFSRVQRPSIISRSVSNTPRWRDINDEVESSSKKTYGIHKPLTQEQKDDRALRIIRANNTRRQELEKNVSKHVNGIIDEKQIPKDTHNSLNEKHVSEKDTSIHSALKAIIRRIRQYTGDIVREGEIGEHICFRRTRENENYGFGLFSIVPNGEMLGGDIHTKLTSLEQTIKVRTSAILPRIPSANPANMTLKDRSKREGRDAFRARMNDPNLDKHRNDRNKSTFLQDPEKILQALQSVFSKRLSVGIISNLSVGDSVLIQLEGNGGVYAVKIKDTPRKYQGKTVGICEIIYRDNHHKAIVISEVVLQFPIKIGKNLQENLTLTTRGSQLVAIHRVIKDMKIHHSNENSVQ